jgi:hypothetical protein
MRGLMEVLWNQKGMFLNPRYDTVGLISLPFFIIFEFAAPVIELTGFMVFFVSWYLGYLNHEFAFWFLMISIVLGSLLSIAGILLMEIMEPRYRRLSDLLRLMFYALTENIGLHQLHTIYRLYGIWEMIVGTRGWGVMTKTGHKNPKPVS